MNILAAMMCLGAYTLLAQLIVMRELTILCLGNELTVGVVFTVWLLSIGAGMWLGRITEQVRLGFDARRQMAILLALLALLLPVVMVLLRFGGGLVRSGAGDTVSLPLVFGVALLALAPIALPAGMLFPAACQVVMQTARRPVSVVYAAEAVGGFLGGAGYSFLMVERLGGLHVAAVGTGLAVIGTLLVREARCCRWCLPVVIGLVMIPVFVPASLNRLEWRTVMARWRAFGIVRPADGEKAAVRLVASLDTRYQNLALVESAGQFALYGDGQIMFSFPDEIGRELAVAFVMAQNPRARRVLLLGGDPIGEVVQLLKHPLETLVHVDLDPGVGNLVRRARPEVAAVLEGESRLHTVVRDGPLFVATCQEQFDAILVHVPEPLTGGLNRFYTLEFYEQVRRLLAPGGFMHTSVEGSEQLEDEASRMASSIYKALVAVFPEVRVTSGSPLHFFAAGKRGTLTLEREALVDRWKLAAVSTRYFLPEYFLGADGIDPDKMEWTERRLMATPVAINTVRRPVSFYYTLALWSRYSGSHLDVLLHRIERVPAWGLGTAILLSGAGCWGLGLVRRRRPGARALSGRFVVCQILSGVGFCGVALELILIYIFQGLYGYVYSRIGLMVGLFMLGSIAGAWFARQWEVSSPETVRWRMILADLVLMAVALAVPCLLSVPAEDGRLGKAAIYLMMAVIGAVVGAQFVGANTLFQSMGLTRARAASVSGAADYGGSALGGILVGVLFVPVWGVGETCAIVASVLGAGLLCLASLPHCAFHDTMTGRVLDSYDTISNR